MKKIILSSTLTLLLALLGMSKIQAQTVDLFCEDFNDTLSNWKMYTYGTPSVSAPTFWADSQVFRGLNPGSASDTVGHRTTSYLESPTIYGTLNYTNIGVQFHHICYLEQFDEMTLEVSFDGGQKWQVCGPSTYTGQSAMKPNGSFSKISRAIAWKFLPIDNDSYVWSNSNAEWASETFNLSDLVDQNSPSDSIKFRIALLDHPASVTGRIGMHQYWIDDFCVRGSNCELIPPKLELDDPPANYPSRYEGRVYNEGPYLFNARATDQSGIDTVIIEYRVHREINGTYTQIQHDTVGMDAMGFGFFNGQIPATNIQVLDSVYWRVIAFDDSPCKNETSDPPQGWSSFLVKPDLPVSCNTTPVYQFPYYQTFNGQEWVSNTSGNLADNWLNVEGDFHDWWVNQGSTPTRGTGPSDDIPGGGKYLYVEATGYPDSTAFLVTPCFDLSEMQNSKVRFYLNQNTVGEDTVWIDIFDVKPSTGYPDGKYDLNVLPPIGGNKGDVWLPYEFTTFKYQNTVTQVRFRARPGRLSDLSDIALDSFQLSPAPVDDIIAERVVSGPYAPEGEQLDVIVNVQNQGITPVTSFLMNYDIIMNDTKDTVQKVRDIPWTGSIPASEYREITVPNSPYTVPLGSYTIKAWVEAQVDQVRRNDTTQQRARGLAYRSTYFMETFDEWDRDTIFTALADADTATNYWALGTPNYGFTNSAFSGKSDNSPYIQHNSWGIILDGPYTGDGNTVQLITPFIDFSNTQNPFLSFFNNRQIDTTKAGVYIEYSLDKGLTWDSVPSGHDPDKIKWYNSYLAADGFGGQPVFADVTRYMEGNWNNWVESELRLPTNIFANEPYVLFRFNFFGEDYSEVANDFNSNAGMSIDNFLVYDEKTTDIETQYIFQPDNKCYMSSSDKFHVAFKNRGTTTINSFDAEFVVTHIPTQTTERKTETFNKTIEPRDTGIVKSSVSFDMRKLGDYKIQVITKMTGDQQPLNDTLTKYVENIDGCTMVLEAVTGAYKRPQVVDSSRWRFDYTSDNGRSYFVTDDYRAFSPFDTNRVDVCIRKNSRVQFTLGDDDTTIVSYSLYAYDGEKDTIFVENARGGTDTPAQIFYWECPPEKSATTTHIYIDNNQRQLPISKDYTLEMKFKNNGLDSIAFVTIGMSIDGRIIDERRVDLTPPLEYGQSSQKYGFGTDNYISPGNHIIKAWTHNPNGNQDELPEDDTLTRVYAALDTTITGIGSKLDSNNRVVDVSQGEYCTNFEEDEKTPWISLNYPGFFQPSSFELGLPSKTILNEARSGIRAWTTKLTGNYESFDSSSVLSPFFRMRKDSCYQFELYHQYYIADGFNDGAQVLMSANTNDGIGNFRNLNRVVGGVGDTALQKNWYNTKHIIAIEDNNENAGWSGMSNGWVRSTTFIPSYEDQYVLFLLRFASDGNNESEGWSVDDICIRSIPAPNCFAVGLDEKEMDLSKLYLGQNLPNPAQNEFEVPYYLPEAGRVYFEVTNALGQTVRQLEMSKTKGNHLLQMDISDLSSGVYYYWIVFNDQKISKKMIISR